jgi:hypothetical protein
VKPRKEWTVEVCTECREIIDLDHQMPMDGACPTSRGCGSLPNPREAAVPLPGTTSVVLVERGTE